MSKPLTKTVVRCVPERAPFIAYLRKRIPEATFYFHSVRGAMEAFMGALKLAGEQPVVHMEDDVILTRSFRNKLEAVIREHPNQVIQFFSMRQADLTQGSRADRNFLMGQCFYLPPGYSAALASYMWPRLEDEPDALDMMVCDWLKSRHEAYWIHVPSLVDHRVCTSAIDPRRSSKRQSKTLVDPWL